MSRKMVKIGTDSILSRAKERCRRVAPKFLVPKLGALFLVSKSGKVRVEEKETEGRVLVFS